MKTRIKSDQLVRYLSMGWKISEIAFNDERCWMVMEGSLRQKVLDDLNLVESDLAGKRNIPGAKITHRMLCCWYAMERYGLTPWGVAMDFDIDPATVRNAREKVDAYVRFHGLKEKKDD